ncbi:MAG TPA: carbohydrate ABC transporter permease [Candidatus Dormibacteraeota bacterium]|jgi:multiple sugar transport system permease protein
MIGSLRHHVRPRRRLGSSRLTAPQALLLGLIVVLTVFPIYWMLVSSVKTNFELLSGSQLSLLPDPRALHLQNYVLMWQHLKLALYLRNSLIICGVATVISVGLASLSGFGLAYFRFRGAGTYSIAVMATQLLPGIMFLLPIYLIIIQVQNVTGAQIVDTHQGLILLYVAFFMPLSIWILRGYFAAIPRELMEAAQVDGCTVMGAFRRVLLPLSLPGLVATATYVFLTAWDELLFAVVMTNSVNTETIPVGIRGFIGQAYGHFELLMAAATAVCVPPALIFLFLQRHMVSGLTAGAVK